MERFSPTIALIVLLLAFPGCKRAEWTRASEPTPPETGTPVWIDLRLVQNGSRFHTQISRIAVHRFATISGRTASYDAGILHVDLTPRVNGDKTVTITANVRKDAANLPPAFVHIPPFTVVENQITDHDVEDLRLHCIATTDPKFFPFRDARPPLTTFIEGTYITPPTGYFASHSYTFEDDGKFIDHMFSDSGSGLRGQFEGRYEIDGEHIILRFNSSKRDRCVFTHMIVDDVHVLMDVGDRPNVPPDPYGTGCYVLHPAEPGDLLDWWNELLTAHPGFAKALPGGGK